MWVQLLTIQQLDIDGIAKAYYPGDFVDIGGQTALRWIEAGIARAFEPVKMELPPGAGIVVYHGETMLVKKLGDPPIITGNPRLAYAKTLLWDTSYVPQMDLVPIGFKLLERWQVVTPLWSYDELASHIGTVDQRELTKNVIHDLRVPCYDVRFMFMRKCGECEQLIENWLNEYGDTRLAFMRALYKVKPLILALPVSWRRK